MATKLTLECELLKVQHDIRFNRNNKNAFNFRASLCVDASEKVENISSAIFYENRQREAENRADHIQNMIADFC